MNNMLFPWRVTKLGEFQENTSLMLNVKGPNLFILASLNSVQDGETESFVISVTNENTP